MVLKTIDRLSDGAKSKFIVGKTYDGDNVFAIGSALNETYYKKQATPPSGLIPGAQCRTEFKFSYDDKFKLNECNFDFLATNSSATEEPTIFNVFRTLSEAKMFINNQEKCHLKNAEEIFLTVGNNLKKFDEASYWAKLNSMRTEFTKTYAGETIGTSSTKYFSLPLTLLFDDIKGLSTEQGLQSLTFELRFCPNYGSASTNGAFCVSNTTNNAWTTSNISFSEVECRLDITRYANPALYDLVSDPLLISNRYEVKQYSVAWNATSDNQKVNLNADFARHGLITGVYAYILPTALITAFNDADSGKYYSTYDYIGYELKYRTKTILKMDAQTADATKRVDYYHKQHQKRFGHFPPALWNVVGSDSASLFYIPMCCIDLSAIELNDPHNEKIIGGVDNNTSDIEIIFTNTKGAWATSATLNVAIEYVEIHKLDKKTGQLKLIKA